MAQVDQFPLGFVRFSLLCARLHFDLLWYRGCWNLQFTQEGLSFQPLSTLRKAWTLTTGNWLFYRLIDYIACAFGLLIAGLARAAQRPAAQPATDGQGAPKPASKFARYLRRALPYLRGVLFALPVLGILGGLLASADPVFGQRIRALLEIFDLERLPEYILRMAYILLFAYIFTGLFLHAALPAREEPRPDPNKAWNMRFLGSTETFIILGGVVSLFGFFLIIQFQYLFGGQSNINETGFTYSEYARRGFFELVWVAVLSIGLYMGLSAITRRESAGQQRAFSLLSILLLAMLLVILVSALQRLLLYEAAYGFTRLRTITHIFIFWMMPLLLAAIVLEAVRRPGHFALALFIFTVGFGLTFSALSLDGVITSLNLQRARAGSELDLNHLTGLSADAVPALAKSYTDPAEKPEVRLRSGAALACKKLLGQPNTQTDWRSFNLPEASAARILASLDLQQYQVSLDNRYEITIDNQTINCWGPSAD